jgi:diketogulonate reductase-like aldo/keto reductase
MRKSSWLALEKLYSQGLVRSIGVSNYTIAHLEDLFTYCTIKPHVNQVEFHPWLYQKDLLDFCKDHSIIVEAYSPLAQATNMTDNLITEIAQKHKKTNAQVLLRWGLQHGVVILPKSSTTSRIKENMDIEDFELSDSDMVSINSLNQNLHVCWDPTTIK